jgi:hypothetical protein
MNLRDDAPVNQTLPFWEYAGLSISNFTFMEIKRGLRSHKMGLFGRFLFDLSEFGNLV